MKEIFHQYVEHRKVVIIRRTKFELKKAEDRAHILEGLKIAIENMNKIVKIIRDSKDVARHQNRRADQRADETK